MNAESEKPKSYRDAEWLKSKGIKPIQVDCDLSAVEQINNIGRALIVGTEYKERQFFTQLINRLGKRKDCEKILRQIFNAKK